MKKIQGLLSVAGLLCMAATASAGWGSGGGSWGSSGGYSAGYGSSGGGYGAGLGCSGGYAAGFGSSGGGYAAGYGSSGGYAAGYGSSGGYSAGHGSSGGVAHVGPLRRLAAHFHEHRAARLASWSSAGSSGGGAGSGGSSGAYYRSASYGSSGGYSTASYGSSGGGASYGSSGHRAHAHGSSGGASHGGYSTGYASAGSYSRTSYGSSGGVHYGASMMSTPVESYGVDSSQQGGVIYDSATPTYAPSTSNTPTIEGPQAPSPLHSGSTSSSGWNARLVGQSQPAIAANEIQLNVRLPESAVVFVNGNRTTSTGSHRRFVSKNLESGSSYRFEVRAEREVNGRNIVEKKSIVLSPGSVESLEFSLDESSKSSETVLTLSVPQDAKVILAGNETKSTGESRTYRTRELAPGQVWEDYKIIVSWNGKTKERTIRLIGGDEMNVSFSFDDAEKVALR